MIPGCLPPRRRAAFFVHRTGKLVLRAEGRMGIVRPLSQFFWLVRVRAGADFSPSSSLSADVRRKPSNSFCERLDRLRLCGGGGGCLGLLDGLQFAKRRRRADVRSGVLPGAQQSFLQAIQSDPNNPDGYYNLARTYQQLGKLHNQPADLQQAESYYHQCLDRDPNRTDCYRALAVLLNEQGRSTDAFRLMEGWAAQSVGRGTQDRVSPALRRVGQCSRG